MLRRSQELGRLSAVGNHQAKADEEKKMIMMMMKLLLLNLHQMWHGVVVVFESRDSGARM